MECTSLEEDVKALNAQISKLSNAVAHANEEKCAAERSKV